MLAQISCPACQFKTSIPEGDMGKRQVCPNCQSPFFAGKSVSESRAGGPASSAAAPGYAKTMLAGSALIKFNCPRCQAPLEVPAIEARTKKPCPSCGQRLQVPDSSPAPQPELNKTMLVGDDRLPPNKSSRAATVLAAGSHAQSGTGTVPTPTPRSPWGRILLACALLIVVGAGVVGAVLLVNMGTKDDKEKEAKSPVVTVDPTKENQKPEYGKAVETPKSGQPKVLIDEDFSAAYKKMLLVPEGWDGDAFRIVKDNELYGLEISKPTGVHFVKLPPLSLSGDFTIEGVYILWRGPGNPALTIRLENRQKSTLLPVVFDWQGQVSIGDDGRLASPTYKPQLPTHFLLKREGKRLRVYLNKEAVADKDLGEVVEFDTVRVGFTAGPGYDRHLARLYGLKTVTLSP